MFDRNTKNYGKSRRVLRQDRQDNKNSGNLKQMHRALIHDSDPYANNAQRASLIQLPNKN